MNYQNTHNRKVRGIHIMKDEKEFWCGVTFSEERYTLTEKEATCINCLAEFARSTIKAANSP